MNMFKPFLPYLVICLSIGVSLLFFFDKPSKENKLKGSLDIQDNLSSQADDRTLFWDIYPELILPNEGKTLNKDLSLTDINESNITLSNLFDKSSDSILIFRFSNFDCDLCLRKTLPILMDFFKDNSNKVNLIVDGMLPKEYRIKFKELKIPFPVYFLNDQNLQLSLENKNIPFFFILDREHYKTHKIFTPSKDYPQHTQTYLRNIKQSLYD
ncbi:hypothetical protein [Sphingobacterium hungaricum]|uniref:AhpC/TSA family protein n=1 Tax=Sphingobacterium hungaricum TaxID=2082723 RepID=A0A928UXG7_9SPHI|nr:hypothetical protein [Sphingobacterium hungaricum]MBE8714803.1 hypothetical protein [Sphingobacterium hungaricum]